jgi:hypothetical protein
VFAFHFAGDRVDSNRDDRWAMTLVHDGERAVMPAPREATR